MHGDRLARWEHTMEWPLMTAAFLFLGAYATQILAHPHGALDAAANVVLWVTWIVFVGDYLVRLYLAEHRWRWFFRHLLELAVVVLPVLRPLRLMRFITIIVLLQRNAGSVLRGRVLLYGVGSALLITVLAALAVFDAERAGHGPIRSYGDALWWVFTTISTVGYGDFYPVTTTGRLIGVLLMAGGIALIGVVTATVSSWIIDRVSHDEAQVQMHDAAASAGAPAPVPPGTPSDAASGAPSAQQRELQELRREVAELKSMIQDLAAGRGPRP